MVELEFKLKNISVKMTPRQSLRDSSSGLKFSDSVGYTKLKDSGARASELANYEPNALFSFTQPRQSGGGFLETVSR